MLKQNKVLQQFHSNIEAIILDIHLIDLLTSLRDFPDIRDDVIQMQHRTFSYVQLNSC